MPSLLNTTEGNKMFNIAARKIGGIRFIQIGRINISFSVTTWAKVESNVEKVAFNALQDVCHDIYFAGEV